MALITPARVGFIGVGVMGTPMALNLVRHFPVMVWNRSSSRVVEQSDFIFTMLFDGAAIQTILDEDFKRALRGKTLINTSSVTVEFSESLAKTVQDAGGTFVEMPVSGSRVPAEQGRLVAMMAGDRHACDLIRPVVKPLAAKAIYCGPIGSGLRMKYTVNSYVIAMASGLAESMNLARAQGLDPAAFGEVVDAGPMASAYAKVKIDKMVRGDWSAQASVKDCYNSTQLVEQAAEIAGTRVPIVSCCAEMYAKAKEEGLGEEDMIAVTKVFAAQ